MLRDGYFNLILPMRKLRQKCYRPTGPCHKQFPKSGLSDSSRPLVITTLPQRPHHDQDNEEMAQETTVFRFSSNALSSSKKVLLLRSFSRKEHRLLNSAGVTGTESGEIMNCFVWKCRGFFPGAVGPTITQPSPGSSDQLWGLEITTVLPSQPVPDLVPSHSRNYPGLIILPLPLLC